MKAFSTTYKIEQKLGLRCPDGVIFGIGMPVAVLFLIAIIAGNKTVGGGDYTFLQSAFASLIAVGICAGAFMGIPLTIADYRDKKILKQFFTTPISPRMLLGVIVACAGFTAVVSGIIVSGTAVIAFDYHMQGNVAAFIGAWFLTLTSMFSIGMLIAALCKNVRITNVVTTAVYFPMLFLSGATIPFEVFPAGVQKVASVLPLTQGIKLMKQVSMGNVDGVWFRVILLVVITVVCCGIAIKTFRWE